MANVDLTVQEITVAGTTPSYTGSLSTSDTYRFSNDGRTFLHVKKSGANNCTVTITTPATVAGQAVADPTVTVVASTGDKMIGPFPSNPYNDSQGIVTVSYSEVTGLTHGAFRVPAVA